MRRKIDFNVNTIELPESLAGIVDYYINNKDTSYYLIVSPWDKVSTNLLFKLEEKCRERDAAGGEADCDLNVVDIFNIPNALEILKYRIKEYRESITTAPLNNNSKLPLLVVMHKAFPRVVDYNGSIFVELGL